MWGSYVGGFLLPPILPSLPNLTPQRQPLGKEGRLKKRDKAMVAFEPTKGRSRGANSSGSPWLLSSTSLGRPHRPLGTTQRHGGPTPKISRQQRGWGGGWRWWPQGYGRGGERKPEQAVGMRRWRMIASSRLQQWHGEKGGEGWRRELEWAGGNKVVGRCGRARDVGELEATTVARGAWASGMASPCEAELGDQSGRRHCLISSLLPLWPPLPSLPSAIAAKRDREEKGGVERDGNRGENDWRKKKTRDMSTPTCFQFFFWIPRQPKQPSISFFHIVTENLQFFERMKSSKQHRNLTKGEICTCLCTIVCFIVPLPCNRKKKRNWLSFTSPLILTNSTWEYFTCHNPTT